MPQAKIQRIGLPKCDIGTPSVAHNVQITSVISVEWIVAIFPEVKGEGA